MPPRQARGRYPAQRGGQERPRGPRPIGAVLTELMAQRGIGQARNVEQLQDLWIQVVGEDMGAFTRAVALKRGQLEVCVISSVWVQELEFQRTELLEKLAKCWPGTPPKGIRFKVGPVG